MARERTLSPEFFTNHLLAKCPPLTRLLLQGIWTLADFDGCFEWEPPALAMKILPRETFDPLEALEQLERDGFIRSYEVDGKRFGYVVNWHVDQDPHPGEKPTRPKPSGDPNFLVKVKDTKYRKDGDLGFGMPDLPKGIYPYEEVVSKLLARGEQVGSNAMPSLPSLPSCPSFPTEVGKVGSGNPLSLDVSQDGEGLDVPETKGIPERIADIMDRWDGICLPDSPFTKIRRREDPSLLSLVNRCLECPGWEEKFGILVDGIPHLPFYRGEVAPSPDYQKPFVARFKWLVSDPSVVDSHSERVQDQIKELQVIARAPKSGDVPPKPSSTAPRLGHLHRSSAVKVPSPAQGQAAQLRAAMEQERVKRAATKSMKNEETP